ncbi:MAG: zonular occludens toxin domain-containing protein [Lautropia sp.]|nr:zonular occludens toxin domain-containing protein [Lautropia sp.]
MITLITGAPGAGKTAALVDLLTTVGKGRPVYVDGIPDLVVPDVDISPLGDPHEWHQTVPDGAVVVIDEVQRVWRPRAPGSRVPPDIEALETHRHKGIDIYIITQGPNLLDRNVRTLVGRHVHLRDIGVLGRYWYEWPECCEQPAAAYRSAPIKRRYRLPKRVFGRYRSASVHIKPVRRIPPALVIFGVAVIGAAILGWRSVESIRARGAEPATEPAPAAQSVPALPVSQAAPKPAVSPAPAPSAWSMGGAGLIDDRTAWIPRVSTRPESAPAYDRVREVRVHPVVVGGACMGGRCRCYTQQATDAGLSSDACREWIERPPFDPYTPEFWPVAPTPAAPVEVASGGAAQQAAPVDGRNP